jgi:hypothetical protein
VKLLRTASKGVALLQLVVLGAQGAAALVRIVKGRKAADTPASSEN